MNIRLLAIVLIALSTGCKMKAGQTQTNNSTDTIISKSKMIITSTAFHNDSTIPQQYTCQGEDISPALAWTGAPADAQSFALLCEDPDAPGGTYIHWVIYNIPATERGLAENFPKRDKLPNGTRQGVNDFKQMGYGGPCPPPGKAHRYYFKLYALDAMINIPGEATRDQLLNAMHGHILAEGETMGTYAKKL
jgi:Raf kinase inhibitor-like YbhB/YbcL family protein